MGMTLFQILMRSWKRTDSWSSAADELAVKCAGTVRNRLGQQVDHMSRNESRGYIRARARSVVKQAVQSAMSQRQTPAELVPQLNNRVLETTTQLVHQQVVNQPFRKPTRRVA
jgi:hypothetical protein